MGKTGSVAKMSVEILHLVCVSDKRIFDDFKRPWIEENFVFYIILVMNFSLLLCFKSVPQGSFSANFTKPLDYKTTEADRGDNYRFFLK